METPVIALRSMEFNVIIARKGLYFSLRARLNIMLFGCVRSTWYIWQFKTFEFDM